MNNVYAVIREIFGDSSALMLALIIFIATVALTFGVMATIHARSSVKRRAAGIAEYSGEPDAADQKSLRGSSARAVQRLIDYTTKHYSTDDAGGDAKVLRRRLIQAGIFDARAVAYFFIVRTVLAVALAFAAFAGLPMLLNLSSSMLWLGVSAGGLAGYLVPGLYIDRRIKKNRTEHREGFPDFLDLLVVCADSGLSIEAALERVGRELGDSYPSLCANIHMTNLEIRAGKTMTEALEHFGDRLGLDEARAFATLIQQSAELGSSINEALRVYSDDMRHKRLSRAEEKAYSLPAKLTVPMMLCIFPVIFVVIMLPVIVRISTGKY
jgi:tight adherence protein C